VQEFNFLGESEVCGRSYCVPVPPVVAIDFDGYVRGGQFFALHVLLNQMAAVVLCSNLLRVLN